MWDDSQLSTLSDELTGVNMSWFLKRKAGSHGSLVMRWLCFIMLVWYTHETKKGSLDQTLKYTGYLQ